jgi:lipopolysaccharide export LptBFGC system permease protein LptF
VKTLHNYLTRQIVASLLVTVMVFTFVLLLGNALKDILPLLVSGQVRLSVVATTVGLLVPFVWVFALPMGMLTATLLTFGRFRADQEFTAVRASGVSLLSLVRPILLLSLVLCGLSAAVNLEIGPRCRVAFTSLRSRLLAELATGQLPEGFTDLSENCVIYIGKKGEGGMVEQVMILMLQNQTNLQETLLAPEAKIEFDVPKRQLNLTLYNAKAVGRNGSIGSSAELPLMFDFEKQAARQANIDDMTFRQLWTRMHLLEQRLKLPIPLKTMSPVQVTTWKAQWKEWRTELAQVTFQIHRQVAFSFACFGFTLVGIPLGIRVHRRETNVGIAIALLLVAVYYSFILVGQALDTRPECLPHLVVWVPNFLFQGVGALLLWRANRVG